MFYLLYIMANTLFDQVEKVQWCYQYARVDPQLNKTLNDKYASYFMADAFRNNLDYNDGHIFIT